MSTILKSNSTNIKWFLTIALSILMLFIPESEDFTFKIKIFLAITIFNILLFAFELVNTLIPAILIPCMYTVFNVAPYNVVAQPWTTTIPVMLLGSFLFANALDSCGLLKRIALWCVLKTPQGLAGIVYGVFFASVITSIITSTQSYVIVAAFCLGICHSLGLEKSKESSVIFLAGVLGAGGSMTYIYAPGEVPLLNVAGQTVDPTFNISWMKFLIDNLPQFFFIVLMVFILGRIANKIDSPQFQNKELFREQYQNLGNISSAEKKAAIISILLILYLLTTNLTGFDIAWGFAFCSILLLSPQLHIVKPQPVIQKTNFSNIFFVTACMSIGTVAGELNISTLFSNAFVPMLENTNNIIIVALIWIFGWFVNLILTPVATLTAFGPIIAQIGADLSINPYGLLYILRSTTDQVILPYEQSAYLIMYSFGMIRLHDFMKFMGFKSILHFIFTLVVYLPFLIFLDLF